MRFKDIIGQEAVKHKLVQSVKNKRIGHAQLFLGPESSGSLALALAYAQFIGCNKPLEDDSCGECSSCIKYNKIIHPDLHFSFPFFAKHSKDTSLDYLPEWRQAFLSNPYLSLNYWRNFLKAENKQANINIAECHQIIRSLSLTSFESAYKVLIIWLPEYLGKNGNALLKLIEEPAPKTLFLLVAENQEHILRTILSRTQLVKITKPTEKAIEDYLCKHFDIDNDRAKQIAFISDGNIEKAIQLSAESGESNFYELYRQWILHCFKNDGLALIDMVEKDFPKMGRENQKSFLHYAVNLMREVVLLQNGLEALIRLSGKENVLAERFADLFSPMQVESIIQLLEEANANIERNANPRILFLDVSLQLVLLLKFQTFPKGTQYI